MQIYRATNQFRSKQIGAALSKQLRKKYGKRSIRILKGDVVKIVRGEYKGVEGKVTKISTEKNSIGVEGVQKEKSKGGKVDILIHSSNGVITSLKTDDKWRVKILEHKTKPKTVHKPKTVDKPKTLAKNNVKANKNRSEK
jgi:large subunit ribosomal protein L24